MKSIILVFSSLMIAYSSISQKEKDAIDEFEKTEKELNSIYNKLLLEYRMDTVFIKHLRESQSLWNKFRDEEVEMKFPEKINGRNSTPYMECVFSYKEKITRERLNALKGWLNGVIKWTECDGSLKEKH